MAPTTNEAEQTFAVPAALSGAHISSREQYDSLYKQSVEDPAAFWTPIAQEMTWSQPWESVVNYNFSVSKGPINIQWFLNGKTNVCYNSVDRHVEAGNGDRIAFFWEGNEPADAKAVTYKQLLDDVCRFANVLLAAGVKAGDRVALYLPMIMELPVAMLACARIGAIHSVVFGGFSSKALADRIKDSSADVLITADGVFRGNKLIELKKIADAALEECEEAGVQVSTCIVVKWQGGEASVGAWGPRYKWYHDLAANASTTCPPVWVDSEAPLFMLYTSGSTGAPKGVVHTTGGYMVDAYATFKYVFDYREGDVYWCTADCGWITGHTYIVYGPLLAGATSVMFEGVPTYPDAGRFWAVCEKYKVNQFYTAPTAIRALMRFGDNYVTKHDLSSLRVLGSVGEPINPEAWLWYYHVVGKDQCAVVDTYWQTETGSHIMTPLPGAVPTKPGSCTVPFFGVDIKLLDAEGKEIEGEGEGFIVAKGPWPSITRTVYNNHARYEATYFSQFDGYYCTGDGGRRDADGYMWVTGRVDDVMCVSGHRIGTAEVEAALASHEGVSEAAAIQVPHDIKGNAIHTFVILKPGWVLDDKLQSQLRMIVRSQVGAFAAPDAIRAAPGLPKTRSGKIMRRVLRKIACHEFDTLGDISTLAEPQVVEQLIEVVRATPAVQGA